MSGNPCLILEWSDCSDWDFMRGEHAALRAVPRRIPEERKPSTMQPNREVAEAEAKRLARLHPGKRFAVFEASVVATTVEVPSHVTISGKVWMTRKQPVLLEIDDSEVPF